MGWKHELTHSLGVLTWHSPELIKSLFNQLWASAADMHYFGRVGYGNGLNIRHLLQLPLKHTVSATHLHCWRCHCKFVHLDALGFTVSY
jgi:hypothetical protein